MRKHRLLVAALGCGTALIAIPLLAEKAPDSGPVARYDMRAGTVSGMAGGMNMMSMMMGGGGSKVQHELYLRLGSSNGPDKGKPKADHFMPQNAKLGKSVALVTPRSEPGPVDEIPRFNDEHEPVNGRILVYWGCGAHAPKGQPFVIDLGKLSRGELPPGQGLWTSTIRPDWGPTLTNSTTFGRWPAEDDKYVKSDSSLIGQHRVAGNYSPEISFTLSKDFMAPLAVSVAANQGGGSLLSWPAVNGATGMIATLFGSKDAGGRSTGDIVMWSSSETRQFGGGLDDWLSPSQVAPLVKDKTLLPGSATSCVVPAEVIAAASDFRMGTLTAFGPEESFANPPRPADAKARWDLQWTARIRHRSTTSWMEAEGMTMGTARDQSGQGECKPRGGLFGGLAGGLMGGGNGC